MPVDAAKIRPEPGTELFQKWLDAGSPSHGSAAYRDFLERVFPDTPEGNPRILWQGVVYEAVGKVEDLAPAVEPDAVITDGDRVLVATKGATFHGGRRVEEGEPIPAAPAFDETPVQLEVSLTPLTPDELIERGLARWADAQPAEASS